MTNAILEQRPVKNLRQERLSASAAELDRLFAEATEPDPKPTHQERAVGLASQPRTQPIPAMYD